jgi:hypothetical protein
MWARTQWVSPLYFPYCMTVSESRIRSVGCDKYRIITVRSFSANCRVNFAHKFFSVTVRLRGTRCRVPHPLSVPPGRTWAMATEFFGHTPETADLSPGGPRRLIAYSEYPLHQSERKRVRRRLELTDSPEAVNDHSTARLAGISDVVLWGYGKFRRPDLLIRITEDRLKTAS